MSILARARFALKYRTLGRIGLSADTPSQLFVYRDGVVVQLKRRCPHQGAPMEKGRIKGGCLVCPWHGYRLSLTGGPGELSVPTAGRRE